MAAPKTQNFKFEIMTGDKLNLERYDVTLQVAEAGAADAKAELRIFIVPTDDGNDNPAVNSGAKQWTQLRDKLATLLQTNGIISSAGKYPNSYGPAKPMGSYTAQKDYGQTCGLIISKITDNLQGNGLLIKTNNPNKPKAAPQTSWTDKVALVATAKTAPASAAPTNMPPFDAALHARFGEDAEFDEKRKQFHTAISVAVDDLKHHGAKPEQARNRIAYRLKSIMGAEDAEAEKLANLYMQSVLKVDIGEAVATAQAADKPAAKAPAQASKPSLDPVKLKQAITTAVMHYFKTEVEGKHQPYDKEIYEGAIDSINGKIRDLVRAGRSVNTPDVKEYIKAEATKRFPDRSNNRYENLALSIIKYVNDKQTESPSQPSI